MVTKPGDDQSLQNLELRQQSDSTSITKSVSGVSSRLSPIIEYLSAMELSYAELQSTVEQAQTERARPDTTARLLRTHVNSLQEDINVLSSYETDDDEIRTKSVMLILEARRLRREIEREAIQIEQREADVEKARERAEKEEEKRTREAEKADREAEKAEREAERAATEAKRSTKTKLAPMKAPTFNGDVTTFHVFRQFFEENVMKDDELTNTAKWLRLTESLEGAPAELISELPRTDHALTVAWKLLAKVYGSSDRPVMELYDRLQKFPAAANETKALRMTHSKLEGIFMTLEQLQHDVKNNAFFKWSYLGKFPIELAYRISNQEEATLEELRTTVDELIQVRERADKNIKKDEPQKTVTVVPQRQPQPTALDRRKPQQQNQAQAKSSRLLSCIFCEGDHWNDACTKFTSAESRKNRLSNKCLKCLRREHPGAQCAIQRRCFHCDSTEHNRALCPVKFKEGVQEKVVQAAVVQQPKSKRGRGYFLTFMAQASSSAMKNPIPVRVVVDTAGGQSVVRKEIAKSLHLRVVKEPATTYAGLGDTQLAPSYRLHDEIILHPEHGAPIKIEADMVDWIIPQVPAPNIEKFREDFPQHASISIPPTGEGRPIDILIGSDMVVEILAAQQIIAADENTLLMPTKFGSLILGRNQRTEQAIERVPSLLFASFKNPIHQMCSLDIVGLEGLHDSSIEEEQQAIQNFYDTIQWLQGRYSISWPWRCFPPQLDSNFGLAWGRLKSLYRRLCHTPELLREYHEIILRQLKEGIVEKIAADQKTGAVVHYVSHHPVIQPGKSTSVRPVYDGSSKTTASRKSLNDNILKGKNWLSNLVKTLLKFRRYKNVVIGDIAKAFHQIAINESDRDAVRFLWLKDPEKPPTEDNLQIYRFTRVAFGIVASPFILSATIGYHAAKQEPNEFLNIIMKDFYADNLVAALQDTVDPVEFFKYAKSFFGTMKMDLTKWATNNAKLQEHIPESDRLPEQLQMVLGLQWNNGPDTLSIKPPRNFNEKIPTRRTVAREMASYFDPVGWATPILLLAKSFYRKIFTETGSWDERLSEEHREEWMQITEKLDQINQIILPRQMAPLEEAEEIQLHAFVDASATAYAIVVYIRVVTKAKSYVAMVSTRNRLTPVKKTTIPKLELAAILLGSRYMEFVREALEFQKTPKTYVWSDSKCALSWMKQDKMLPTAVEKYIKEAKACQITEYRYVPSSKNFADVASRGADYETLDRMNWWNGPQWLEAESQWPKNELYTPADNVSLVFQSTLCSRKEIVNEDSVDGIATLKIRDYSLLPTLLRRTVKLLQAVVKMCKRNPFKNNPDISLRLAERLWISWDQNREYALASEPEAGKEFLLKGIRVFRDEEGILRCQTRIVNSVFGIDAVNPILLVKNSTLTKLIVLQVHRQHHHAGTSHTLANLRQKYWLPHGRRQVYKILTNDCFACRRYQAKTYPNPPPAPLPEFRVTRSQKPFEITGLDIFGPVKIRVFEEEKWKKKDEWVIIFTCATIRAIHLEVIADMTTEEVLLAFRRFVARRGVPKKLVSDNAPQFHALDRYFTSLWHTIHKAPSVSTYMAEKQIEWEFTVELAPWMGGIYERLIKSVKYALEKALAGKTLQRRQMEAVIIETEAIVNARPIAYVERDPEAPIITPNDFLMAKHVAIPIHGQIEEADDTLERLWKSSQAYLDEFWKHWANYYLMLLRERNDQLHEKRHNAQYTPSKGDIVVMEEIGKRRSQWQTAVVERLVAGRDGQTRSVQIRIPGGSRLIRPVITLAPLRIKMDLPNVHDNQLTKKRDALILWSAEGGSSPTKSQNPNAED